MIVVTRCLSDKESDVRLADKFLEVTREKQAERDEKKREKVGRREEGRGVLYLSLYSGRSTSTSSSIGRRKRK